MIDFRIEELTPKFILRDRTGRALAKGIETALKTMCGVVNDGVNAVVNVDIMPEWRLDELAWETNCLYDYGADITQKRRWIKDAIPLYRAFGTPSSIVQYLTGYFDDIEVEEWPGYNGSPFHFRVTVSGKWTDENEAWARRAIAASQNVRSVLDSLRIGCKCQLGITAEGETLTRFAYPMTGPEHWAGCWPQQSMLGALDESGKAVMRTEEKDHRFNYPLTGTKPQENTLGVLDSTRTALAGKAKDHAFFYPMTGVGSQAGTFPMENMTGVLDTDIRAAETDERYAVISYKLCGEDD